MFILFRLTQHFSCIIMPVVIGTDYVNNCMWSMPGCVGCSRAELGHELCALCESWYTKFHAVHTARVNRLCKQLHVDYAWLCWLQSCRVETRAVCTV